MDDGNNPYYPVNDSKNTELVKKYREEASNLKNVFISGRLGDYKYYDMHETIQAALELYEHKIKKQIL
jgi:UDP-galactopyranose mutase